MSTHYDAIVIGAGQSGPSLAVRLAQSGRNTVIIERKLFGGTCVNVGCIPSKTLVASARAAHVARHAADYGVVAGGEVRVDMARVKARKDAVVAESHSGVENWLRGTQGLTVIQGHARFTGPHTVQVNGETLQAPWIFLDVGARATVPDMPGLAEVPYLTNSSMMDVDFLPEHLVIIGGSYIGLEFAQMYRRFGSRVTVVEQGPRIVSREDPDFSDALRAILEGEGIDILTDAGCIAASRHGTGVMATLAARAQGRAEAAAHGPRSVTGSHLLLAVGRTPNTDDLGCEVAGIRLDKRGHVQVDDALHSSVPGVWAMGECNGRGAFTHTSYNDYEIVAANLLDGDARRVTDRHPIYGLFTDPPLARIGMNETEVRASGKPALMGVRQMTRVGRARERGETAGFMKVLVDRDSKRILGATLLGIEADEAIHCIAATMYAGQPCTTLQRAVFIHPTVSELIPTLLGELSPLK
jgi:pyruvate/2-oxoglutarate dehydrogenase complex dihydrolipoamide dehydrogenase (E3) component